jgi:hypothetical protein
MLLMLLMLLTKIPRGEVRSMGVGGGSGAVGPPVAGLRRASMAPRIDRRRAPGRGPPILGILVVARVTRMKPDKMPNLGSPLGP